MSTPRPPADPHARPRLRPGLSAHPAGENVALVDPYRIGAPVELSPLAVEVVRRFDGTNTLADVQADLLPLTGGRPVPLDTVAHIAAALDDALLLDSPTFRESPAYAERVLGPVRPPASVGAYHDDPDRLRAQLAAVFTGPGGPGLPGDFRPGGRRLRAALLPHMDYARGNVTYGWGFKELAERTDARVFVVVATSHYSPHRFTLTRQHFGTPLGTVATDQDYVREVERAYGGGLFDDPLAHVPEHSVELEVVLLQYLLGGRRPFRIVPLLVGSFADCVAGGTDPGAAADVGRMVAALRAAEAACGEPVCYLISGDLAHIGPKFGDPRPAAGAWLGESRGRDRTILDHLERADPAGYFGAIAAEGDARRICGLPPTWLTLAAAAPGRGRVLHYQQFVHPQGHESVSFAAAAFDE